MSQDRKEEFVDGLIRHVRSEFDTDDFIPLHAPRLGEAEREMVLEALDSGMVSSVGRHVGDFEQSIAEFTGARFAVATVNGTAALHTCLMLAGVQTDEEVITQSLTFVATCNAIRYCHAHLVFVDVESSTLGMSPNSLKSWLQENAEIRDDGLCWNRVTGRVIRACVPMHCFGHPLRIDRISEICRQWNLILIEDAAESLGSLYRARHTGLEGKCAAISFNGNKIITAGGGGMIITDDKQLADHAKHLTTTAKRPHPWLYIHDEVGYNYRMPAINAALGCAQMQSLSDYVERKRALAQRYADWFSGTDYEIFVEPEQARSNYWFNAFFARDRAERDSILEATNEAGVMTRPCWTPMHLLPLYKDCQKSEMETTESLENRLVAIPSSVI